MRFKNTSSGFTLIELMFTLLVGGILLGLAVPAMRDFIMNNRLTAAANDFVAGVTSARSEAIKRGVNVELEQRSGNWSDGWQVNDKITGAGVLHLFDPEPGITATPGGGLGSSMIFRASGIRTSLAVVNLKLCDSRGKGRRVEIKGLGTASVCWINYSGRPEECTTDNTCP